MSCVFTKWYDKTIVESDYWDHLGVFWRDSMGNCRPKDGIHNLPNITYLPNFFMSNIFPESPWDANQDFNFIRPNMEPDFYILCTLGRDFQIDV